MVFTAPALVTKPFRNWPGLSMATQFENSLRPELRPPCANILLLTRAFMFKSTPCHTSVRLADESLKVVRLFT